MSDHSLLKNCLNNTFFEENKSKLRPALFDDSLKDIYSTIESAHQKFNKDITSLELMTVWKSKNPTSTGSWTAEIEDHIHTISEAEEIDTEISAEVIESLWRQSIGLDVANLGILMSEGHASAMDQLTTLVAKVSKGYLPDDYGENVTDDIYELLAVVSDDNRFKFNIETLSRNVYGIGRGEFGVIAAYSNVGKTAFAISLCAAPGGFCQQGAKVCYVANEEYAKRTKLRAIQAYTGMTKDEIALDPAAASARYAGIRDRLVFVDAQGWDIQMLEGYIARENPDIIIVDMADKISLSEKFNSGHERLRELYYRLRECAKKANDGNGCAVIGISQASAEAEGKTRLTPTMLEGSKVGKISETDLLIGIGRMDSADNPDDPARWITVMKNKISGWHGTVQCNLEGKVSRYVV
tara:strand:+ start:2146 stop:3375 length:1230 start_codon:yes stop_codon:yes gene_type:complete